MKKWSITILTLVLPFAILTIITSFWDTGTITISNIGFALLKGIIFALLFTYTTEWFKRRTLKKVMIQIESDEQLLLEGGANHFKGAEGVGGKLVLTNRRLIFKSHNLNIQNHQQSIDISQIKSIREKSNNIFSRFLILELLNKEIHKFVVDSPSDWHKLIQSQKV